MTKVPTWFIHRRIYNDSYRLPKLKRPSRLPTGPKTASFDINHRMENPLDSDSNTWLHRYYCAPQPQTTVICCRSCGLSVYTTLERRLHGPCEQISIEVLEALRRKGDCIICGRSLLTVNRDPKHMNVPLCSENCFDVWKIMVPRKFREMQSDVLDGNPRYKENLARVKRKVTQEMD